METKAIKERPILFSGPMVRALLAGTKTQTRRAIKNQPPLWVEGRIFCERFNPAGFDKDGEMRPGPEVFGAYDEDGCWGAACPYGEPGDRLWVRETTRSYNIPNIFTGQPTGTLGGQYVADGEPVLTDEEFDLVWWYSRKSCPAIHMPRVASRLLLEITAVRVEQLNDIGEANAVAEGIEQTEDWGHGWVWYQDYLSENNQLQARESYASLWRKINGLDSWAANPWVWVVEFKVISPATPPIKQEGGESHE